MGNTIDVKAWVNGDNGLNWMLKMDGWHISYNRDTSNLGGFMVGDQEQETAICVDGNYYILNGDFRQEYESLSEKGLDACITFFLTHPELKSSWSDTPKVAGQLALDDGADDD